MDIFDFLYEDFKFKRDKPIKLFEAFAGIGTQHMALKRLGVDVDLIGIAEVDKHAISSYQAIHGKVKNYGGVGDFDFPNNIDILTWSFPCQDISIAGKQQGMRDGTRSNYGYVFLDSVEKMDYVDRPKVLLMENVPALLYETFKDDWREIQLRLERMGYSSYTDVLNSKDYGVAQNRNRVFVVSIKGEFNYNFPKPFKLKKRLKDYLEDVVDEKYYLSDKQIAQISSWNAQQKPLENARSENAKTIQTITAKSNTSMNASMILINEKTKQGYAKAKKGDGVYINRPHQKRGVVQKGMIQTLKTNPSDVGVVVERTYSNKSLEKIVSNIKDINDVNNTITANPQSPTNDGATLIKEKLVDNLLKNEVVKDTKNYIQHESLGGIDNARRAWKEDKVIGTITTQKDNSKVLLSNPLRIRKLTPLEAWRLMGIKDEDFHKVKAIGMSDSQLYKQAGNAIVVDVLVAIFKELIE